MLVMAHHFDGRNLIESDPLHRGSLDGHGMLGPATLELFGGHVGVGRAWAQPLKRRALPDVYEITDEHSGLRRSDSNGSQLVADRKAWRGGGAPAYDNVRGR